MNVYEQVETLSVGTYDRVCVDVLVTQDVGTTSYILFEMMDNKNLELFRKNQSYITIREFDMRSDGYSNSSFYICNNLISPSDGGFNYVMRLIQSRREQIGFLLYTITTGHDFYECKFKHIGLCEVFILVGCGIGFLLIIALVVGIICCCKHTKNEPIN